MLLIIKKQWTWNFVGQAENIAFERFDDKRSSFD